MCMSDVSKMGAFDEYLNILPLLDGFVKVISDDIPIAILDFICLFFCILDLRFAH